MNEFLRRRAEAAAAGQGLSRPSAARPAIPLTPRLREPQPIESLTGQAKVDAQARLDSLRTELTLVKDRTLGDFTREDGKEVGKIEEEIARVADSISVGSEPRPSFLGEKPT